MLCGICFYLAGELQDTEALSLIVYFGTGSCPPTGQVVPSSKLMHAMSAFSKKKSKGAPRIPHYCFVGSDLLFFYVEHELSITGEKLTMVGVNLHA